ncbi:MAG: C1 family peptidase [Lentisphaeria bacterium]|nr:C1 family peptidase [Lentisphaeria bacterium]
MNIFSESTEYRLKGFPRKTDQGERGTCAAFSTVAMLEYYLDFKERLSPQHLYAICHLDNDTEGCDIARVFSSVKEYGVCRYSEWPYNRNRGGHENQTVAEVLHSLNPIRFENVEFQMLKTNPPRGIDEYKSVLSGADGKRPSPIVVGCKVFSTTFDEPGWAKLPTTPFDAENGYHAMLIYGWKDTPGMESKGYFYVQNSWGSMNDIKIPFEYIEEYAYSAGRFVAEAGSSEVEEPEIATDSGNNETVKEAPVDEKVDVKVPGLPAKATADKNDFFTSQKKNMMDGEYSYPGIRLPFPKNIGAFWNVKTSCFNQAENHRNPEGFRKYLEQKGIKHLYNEVKIFRIQIQGSAYYHLVSAFLYRNDGKQVDMNDVDQLLHYYNDVYSRSCRVPARYTIFTVGTSGKFADGCSSSCDPALFLCEPGEDGAWLFHLPKAECGWITQEFFSHLLPGSYYIPIKNKLDNWVGSGVINKDTIRESLGAVDGRGLYDRQVESALDLIFSSGEYAKNKAGNIIPPTWNIPAGYKKKKRYGHASKRQLLELILWLIPTVLVIAMVTLSLKKEIGYIVGVISVIVGYKRNQAWQSFRYERIK